MFPGEFRISPKNQKKICHPEILALSALLIREMDHVLPAFSAHRVPGNPDRSFRRFLMASSPRTEERVADLFDEKYETLRRYVTLLGLSPEDAEDAVQETFLRLHRHLRSGGDQQNLEGWLIQVGRNVARDKLRSRWSKLLRARPERETEDSLRDPAESAEASLLNEERLVWLRTAMAQLTPQQAECFRLRAAGLRYREIAAAMDIGISAAGELVQRAMARLQEASNE